MDCGDYGHDIQISTGAPNVYVGMHTPAALDGATLPGGIKIKAKPLMGVESNGMLCSGEELGLNEDLYPGAEVYGLLDLPKDTVPGADIVPVVGWTTISSTSPSPPTAPTASRFWASPARWPPC